VAVIDVSLSASFALGYRTCPTEHFGRIARLLASPLLAQVVAMAARLHDILQKGRMIFCLRIDSRWSLADGPLRRQSRSGAKIATFGFKQP
jgi:hypothetical protein